MHIRKFTPSGNLVWENVRTFWLSSEWTDDTRISFRDIDLSATRVMVQFQARRDGGTGAFVGSYLEGFNLDTGVRSLSSTDYGAEYDRMCINGDVLARLRKEVATGQSWVDFTTASGLSNLGSRLLGSVASRDDVVVDSDGFAYIALTNASGSSARVVKCSATTTDFTYNISVAGFSHLDLSRVAVDASVDRLYLFGTGINDASPNNRHALLYRLSTTGAILGLSILGSSQDDFAGDLTPIPGQGVIVSSYGLPSGSTVISRVSATGVRLWDRVLSGTDIGAKPPSHALDPDGNLLILDRTYSTPALTPMRVTRINSDSGEVLDSLELGHFNPHQLFTDAAGNFYINADRPFVGASLLRAQPARLDFAMNNLPGGSITSGTIRLPQAATAAQEWRLASSHPSLVSLPATATIAMGYTSVSFPMNIFPAQTNTNVTVNARYGGFIIQKAFTVLASRLTSVGVSPNVVVGGVATEGRVLLDGVAPAGGKQVELTTSKPAVATVPSLLAVPTFSYHAFFTITTYAVNANQGVVLTGRDGSITRTAFFAVNAPSLMSISVSPTTIQGGLSGSLTLNLNGIAPVGGFSIVLFSGAPSIVTLPTSTSVTVGLASRTINVPTAAVTSTLPVTIFATRSGLYKTTTLTVTP